MHEANKSTRFTYNNKVFTLIRNETGLQHSSNIIRIYQKEHSTTFLHTHIHIRLHFYALPRIEQHFHSHWPHSNALLCITWLI